MYIVFSFLLEALGIQEAIKQLTIVERDETRQSYLRVKIARSGHMIRTSCIHEDVREVAGHGKGACFAHNQVCTLPKLRIHLGVFGPPCKAFSSKRTKTADSATDHKDFDAIELCLRFIAKVTLSGGIVEEVAGFARKKKDGRSFCDEFCDELRAMGYSVAVRKLNANIWFNVPRDRLVTHTY
jgi:site-specific DNA-cytosine methylase